MFLVNVSVIVDHKRDVHLLTADTTGTEGDKPCCSWYQLGN